MSTVFLMLVTNSLWRYPRGAPWAAPCAHPHPRGLTTLSLATSRSVSLATPPCFVSLATPSCLSLFASARGRASSQGSSTCPFAAPAAESRHLHPCPLGYWSLGSRGRPRISAAPPSAVYGYWKAGCRLLALRCQFLKTKEAARQGGLAGVLRRPKLIFLHPGQVGQCLLKDLRPKLGARTFKHELLAR